MKISCPDGGFSGPDAGEQWHKHFADAVVKDTEAKPDISSNQHKASELVAQPKRFAIIRQVLGF